MDPESEFLAREEQALKELDLNSPPAKSTTKSSSSTEQQPSIKLNQINQINQESQAINEWKIKFNERITEIDKTEQEKHEKLLEKAKIDLEQFYKNIKQEKAERLEKLEHLKEQEEKEKENRTQVSQIDSNFWNLISDQVEKINRPKGSKDISRIKEMISTFKSSVQDE